MNTLDLTDDIIDVRDIIERIDELEEELETFDDEKENEKRSIDWKEEKEELNNLLSIMTELESVGGGDEQWRGDWYPITLIRDSYFTDYARELLEDCGDLPRELPHYIEIDWEKTARNIRVDYTSVEINGATYWTR